MDHVEVAATKKVTALSVMTVTSNRSATPTNLVNPTDLLQKPTLSAVPLPSAEWIKDEQVTSCEAVECGQQFTLFNRKHHCRTCGHIFCANCSSHLVSTTDGSGTVRVCNTCYYEHQLVISRYKRGPNVFASHVSTSPTANLAQTYRKTLLRGKNRGEFNLVQLSLVMHLACFLPLKTLSQFALVCVDFYFAARSNSVWGLHISRQFNSTSPTPHGSNSGASTSSNVVTHVNGHVATASTTTISHQASPATPDPSTSGTMYSRFEYSQFGQYVKQATTARWEGVTTFAARVKQLLTNNFKICVVGPCSIGKTSLVRNFLGELAAASNAPLTSSGRMPTIGFAAHQKRVQLAGGLSAETSIDIYDTSGDPRHDSLRALCCQSSHAIILCYSVHSKQSLVEAALIMQEIEALLTVQVVITCGLISAEIADETSNAATQNAHVSKEDAQCISVRCVESIQVHNTNGFKAFEAAIQAVIHRIEAVGMNFNVPTPSVLDILLEA